MTKWDKVLRDYIGFKAERRDFLVRLGSAGLGVAAGTFLAGCGGSSNNSVGAQSTGFVAGISAAEIRAAFLDIQTDENNHVTFLASALGSNARPRPSFDPTLLTVPNGNQQLLWKAASALENTGPGAYLGAVPYISSTYLQDAAAIAIVEGRHAGFLNILTGKNILLSDPNSPVGGTDTSTAPFNLPTGLDSQSPPQSGNGTTLTPGDPTGFTGTTSQEIPQLPPQVFARAAAFTGTVNAGLAPANYTGGSGTYLNDGPGVPSNTFSSATPGGTATGFPQTDPSLIILNYALLLEYLERDFYNINVTSIYGGSPGFTQAVP